MISSKLRVAVLRGGPSNEYDVSLKSGENILSALREMDAYEPVDIFISKSGEWHREGLVHEPHHALRHVDVVWNALHGSYGEDGQVQRVLDGLQIPFTGSGAVASALSMNKDMAKRLYQEHSLPTPAFELVAEESFDDDQLINIFRTYLHPVVVKPANATGSLGIRLAHTFHELKEAIKETFEYSPRVIVEERVLGDDVSCVVVEGANGERIYSFEPIRIETKKRVKRLTEEENKSVEEMARRAHEALGLRHYSTSNFIITPKRKIYILETNSLPTFHEGSLMHQSLNTVGWDHRDFVDHVLKLTV